MHQLRRRIVVDVLIPNTGDHPRNHGFLYAGPDGWRLSPADDPNPVPGDVKPRALRAAVDCDDRSASPPWAMSPAEYFDLDTGEARDIAAEVGRVVTTWPAKRRRPVLRRRKSRVWPRRSSTNACAALVL